MSAFHNNPLPIKDNISLIYIFSFLIAILMVVVSVAGLQYRMVIYPTGELFQSFVPNDVVNLFIGLPALLTSMWLAWRGKLIGLLCWTGALFFVLYNYIAYVFVMPFSWLFPMYLCLVAFCIYTLIGLVASMDGKVIRQRLAGAVAERLAGGVLVGLGLLFFLRVIGLMVNSLSSGILPTQTELAVNIADVLITPAWIIGGILLWQHNEIGYVTGLGLLFQGSMLFIAVIVFLLLQPLMTGATFAITDVVVLLAMGTIFFIPFSLYIRGVTQCLINRRNRKF